MCLFGGVGCLPLSWKASLLGLISVLLRHGPVLKSMAPLEGFLCLCDEEVAWGGGVFACLELRYHLS